MLVSKTSQGRGAKQLERKQNALDSRRRYSKRVIRVAPLQPKTTKEEKAGKRKEGKTQDNRGWESLICCARNRIAASVPRPERSVASIPSGAAACKFCCHGGARRRSQLCGGVLPTWVKLVSGVQSKRNGCLTSRSAWKQTERRGPVDVRDKKR